MPVPGPLLHSSCYSSLWPEAANHDLLYYTDQVSTTIQAQDTQYQDVSSMTGPCIGTYWSIVIECYWIVSLIS